MTLPDWLFWELLDSDVGENPWRTRPMRTFLLLMAVLAAWVAMAATCLVVFVMIARRNERRYGRPIA